LDQGTALTLLKKYPFENSSSVADMSFLSCDFTKEFKDRDLLKSYERVIEKWR
jgi:hypothetical protein